MAPVSHLVLIKLPNATSDDFEKLHAAFLELKTGCKKPDGSNYIVSIRGGPDNSPEDAKMNKDYTHAFVVEFRSKEDRDYYVKTDPFHSEYAARLLAATKGVDNVLVLDFEDGN